MVRGLQGIPCSLLWGRCQGMLSDILCSVHPSLCKVSAGSYQYQHSSSANPGLRASATTLEVEAVWTSVIWLLQPQCENMWNGRGLLVCWLFSNVTSHKWLLGRRYASEDSGLYSQISRRDGRCPVRAAHPCHSCPISAWHTTALQWVLVS